MHVYSVTCLVYTGVGGVLPDMTYDVPLDKVWFSVFLS